MGHGRVPFSQLHKVFRWRLHSTRVFRPLHKRLSTTMSSRLILILAYVAHLISFSHAYTWTFNNIPRQCSQLSASIEGTGGEPPYNILIIPYGSSPLTPIEVRTIQTIAFNSSTDVDFTLNYPAGSQFVAVVSPFLHHIRIQYSCLQA